MRDCLGSLASRAELVVYVDSGSTDGSVELARSFGAVTVELDDSAPFTAARGRNAGFAKLRQLAPQTTLVQFVDGDCEVVEGWIETARAFLEARPDVAVVCGRVRERYPQASVYNRLCDREWRRTTGPTDSCGGIAMIRSDALLQSGGYRQDLTAGEEPELCFRLREVGWMIWRLEHDMALHDAGMTRFGQWWRRTMRGGYAYAEVSMLHKNAPERIWRRQMLRAVFWAFILPVLVVGGAFMHPLAMCGAVLYPVQIVRVAVHEGGGRKRSWEYALFIILAKFAEFVGIIRFLGQRRVAKSFRLLPSAADKA